jgi:UDP-GlcNAc:undecaprenyl-phosphate/decaprenyl-phosphate GlcNAc-1-phosphate transferase
VIASHHILKYPLALLIGYALTLVLTPLFIRIAPALRLMDMPGARHIHTRPTPRGGGIVLFIAFQACCACFLTSNWLNLGGSLDQAWWAGFTPPALLLLAVGLLDDRLQIKPWVKLAGQVAAALLAYNAGIRFGSLPGLPLAPAVDLAFTLVWFLVLVNAFNLIDGMDGVATGLALIAALGLAISLQLQRFPGDVLILLALAGCCAGFLRYNFHPARVFLGDTGSMFLGFTIAAIALSTASKGTLTASMAVPLFAVGVPVFDVILAIWRRSVRHALGRSGTILEGDTDHLHHRLARRGLSQRRVATTLYFLSGLLVVLGIAFMVLHSHALGIALAAFVAGTYVVVRHLARVEIWDTGTAILEGIRRPPRKAISVMLHPPLDIVALSMGWVATLALVLQSPSWRVFREAWLASVVPWVGLPFLGVVASQAYRRIWSRARVAEFALLALGLIGGLVAAAAMQQLTQPLETRELFVRGLLFSSFALPAVVGLRVFRRIVQDAMSWVRGHQPGAHPPRRVLLYGAGYAATLLLRARSFDHLNAQGDRNVVAALDDDSNVHGRMVHGIPVLGGINCLQKVLKDYQIEEIVATAALEPTVESVLLDTSRRAGIPVRLWRLSLLPYGEAIARAAPPTPCGKEPK